MIQVVPLNTNQTQRNLASKSGTSGPPRLIIPASVSSGPVHRDNSKVTIPASALSQLASGQAIVSSGGNAGNIVVLPAQFLQQQQQSAPKPKVQKKPFSNYSCLNNFQERRFIYDFIPHQLQHKLEKQNLFSWSNIILQLFEQCFQPPVEEPAPKSANSSISSSPGSQSQSGNISIMESSKRIERSASFSDTEANGIRPRKPCNCTKSQCLKL